MYQEYEVAKPYDLPEIIAASAKFTDTPSQKYGLTTDKVNTLNPNQEEIDKAYKTLDLFLQTPKKIEKVDPLKLVKLVYKKDCNIFPVIRINVKLDPFND